MDCNIDPDDTIDIENTHVSLIDVLNDGDFDTAMESIDNPDCNINKKYINSNTIGIENKHMSLMDALEDEDFETAMELIENLNYNINKRNKYDETALMLCCLCMFKNPDKKQQQLNVFNK